MRRLIGPSTNIAAAARRLLLCPPGPLSCNGASSRSHAASSTPPPHNNPFLRLSPPVADALASNAPIVALESTIITHGMPYPDNLRTAQEVEAVVRAHGATPATIAILGGKICVGLNDEELEVLAKTGTKAAKCSRRDMATAVALNKTGSTTVASTLAIARMAGLKVFVTGGVGGVHRGAETTMDVSADLIELGRIPGLAVVCAGVKSILDIGKTLEVLETQGVPVLGYGTDAFPAFFTPDSGLPAPARVDSAEEVAGVMVAASACALPSSVLVAVPNPEPAMGQATQLAIDAAVQEAEALGLRGQRVTPFVLQRVSEATGGESLRANIGLIKHNAKVGAQIAVALARGQQHQRSSSSSGSSKPTTTTAPTRSRPFCTSTATSSTTPSAPPTVLVVGGAVMDVIAAPQKGLHLEQKTSTPGSVQQKEGGVGRNVAEGLARLGVSTSLLSAVGDDPAGTALLASLKALAGVAPLELGGVLQLEGRRTAACVALLDEHQDLHAAIADMDIFAHALPPSTLQTHLHARLSPPTTRLVVADGNLCPQAFAALADACARHRVPLLFEPTSVAKATLPVQARALARVAILKPNLKELGQLAWVLQGRHGREEEEEEEEGRLEGLLEEAEEEGEGKLGEAAVLNVVLPALRVVLRALQCKEAEGEWACGWGKQKHVLVTLGAHGLVWGRAPALFSENQEEEASYFPVRPVREMVDCTGAGDTLVAAVAAALVAKGSGVEQAIRVGLAAARKSVLVKEAVPKDLSLEELWADVAGGGEGEGR